MKIPSDFDVVVVGGGPAGIVAASQAGKLGARVLLIEKSGILGGATTLNGVNFPGLFHAWGKQVIAGIGWKLVSDSVEVSGGVMPDFSRFHDVPHYKLQIPVDKAVFACLADRLILESDVHLLLHAMVGAVNRSDSEMWKICLCTKEGLREVRAVNLVDCTGDANVARQAGATLHRSRTLQPGTLIMHLAGYSMDGLAFSLMEEAFERAVASGHMRRSDFAAAKDPVRSFLNVGGNNAMHVPDVDGETSEGKTRAECLAREAMLRIIVFLRQQPGLEGIFVESFSSECGIRETASVLGESRISCMDYLEGRVWPDSVSHSFYPIDIHLSDGIGIDIRPLKEGVVPTIPLSAMLPQGTSNLLVAGRCASGDRVAQSAFRVQASAMAMGQAAGVAAALSADSRRDSREISFTDICKRLSEHGAIVPKVSPSSRAFSLIELLTVIAIMAVLLSLIVPVMNTGGKLASSGNRIAGLADQARQRSMSRNVMTALILNTDAATGGDYRAFTLLEYNAEDVSPQWKQVAQWESLPTGIVVDTDSAFLSNSPNPLPFATASTLPVTYQNTAVSSYAARVFMPSGALNNPGYPAQIQLVEGVRQGSATIYTRPNAAGNPANWYRIAIIGATGRGKIERP